ncbi:general amidase [Laetiporus sulphureus 93-53]|uniref:General amidase n=1 Tax=Laetiporus sulphureus 93-53 TaxID=1314785 RepID=A0A165GRR3_9APHY|nr:general amidase [Laetiporus sulphureus 93-53]KZT10717.1 general amidase [Laetiporus sulphureus 93-53]
MSQSWQDLVADKRQRQKVTIPKDWLIDPPPDTVLDVTAFPEECGLLSERELQITCKVDVNALLAKLATGEWSSVEVTTAFYKRAIIAHQLVNCLTEVFVERALARAAELDEYLKSTGKVVGPLHGLPVSLKDQLAIKGLETTMGYASWIGKYAENDAVLVEILYECGAVPFVRTNVPQTLMWPETYNLIFGRTTNPANRSLTSGGSSGGEGALIHLKGSPLGVGSDLGGSIRIPALFNGIYGLRPSYGRVPYEGAVNSMYGQDSIPSVLGPLSNSLSGIKGFMQAVISRQPWLKDPLAVRKKWDEEAYALAEHGGGENLCFAIMWDDRIVIPQPPITRALQMTKNALLTAGHNVIDWQPLKHLELTNAISAVWKAGSAEDFKNTTAATGEPIISTMIPAEDGGLTDHSVRPGPAGISAYQMWQIHKTKAGLRKEYLDHWRKTQAVTGTGRPVDAIICPGAPFPAPPHGKNWNTNYTKVWNALDYVACVFPVTRVDPSVDTKKPPHEFLNELDERNYNTYDPAIYHNAPVSLQLVGHTLEEEAVIAMTEIVDAALKASSQS